VLDGYGGLDFAFSYKPNFIGCSLLLLDGKRQEYQVLFVSNLQLKPIRVRDLTGEQMLSLISHPDDRTRMS